MKFNFTKTIFILFASLILSVEAFAVPLIELSLTNRRAVSGVYYADLVANVTSGNIWGLNNLTIGINYNLSALSGFDGALLNPDPDLIGINQVNNVGFLTIGFFSLNTYNKTGLITLGTVRWNITDGTLNDDVYFFSNNEIYNYYDLLNYGCDEPTCYQIINPSSQRIIPLVYITTGEVSSPICFASSVYVPFTSNVECNSGDVFNVQLSDASGSFASPSIIGTYTAPSAINSGTINAALPSTLTLGSNYRIRVVNITQSITGGDNGSNLALQYCSKNVTVTAMLHGMWNGTTHVLAPVYAELRQGGTLPSSTVVARKAGILNSAGTATFDFSDVSDGNYYLVIRTPGYLPLARPSTFALSTDGFTYDFTTGSSQAAGTTGAMYQHSSGKWVARCGDFNGSRSITASDANLFLTNSGNNITSYVPAP